MSKALFYQNKYNESFFNLEKAIKGFSNANVCFVPFVTLQTALKLDIPKVVQVHDLFTIQFYDLFKNKTKTLANYKKYNKNVINNLNNYIIQNAKFICSSNHTKKYQILKYLPTLTADDCNVISFPPLVYKFRENEVLDENTFREKNKINGDYIAFPSQNRPNKNLIQLLEAILKVNQNGIDIKLVTTGKMNDLKDTSVFLKKHKKLIIEVNKLELNELYCLYKYSKMVVCPNIIEGMGISGQCLEALSIGNIPVVHVKSYGILESLQSVGLDYDSADLNWIDIGDVEGMTRKICEVYNNPAKHITKQKDIVLAYEKKSWKQVCQEMLHVFNEAIM